MQDWNYIATGCLDLTLEMNDDKWPPPEEVRGTGGSRRTLCVGSQGGKGGGWGLQLPMLWSQHKGSLLALVDLVAKVREEEAAWKFPPG